jgi:hypothetical protein
MWWTCRIRNSVHSQVHSSDCIEERKLPQKLQLRLAKVPISSMNPYNCMAKWSVAWHKHHDCQSSSVRLSLNQGYLILHSWTALFQRARIIWHQHNCLLHYLNVVITPTSCESDILFLKYLYQLLFSLSLKPIHLHVTSILSRILRWEVSKCTKDIS